tara:strand:- start:543 stop:1562 length:1020 start_codon:yes stop_codon:yes gene_type:complete
MVDRNIETAEQLTLDQAASLLVQPQNEQTEEQTATEPEEIQTEDQALPEEVETEETEVSEEEIDAEELELAEEDETDFEEQDVFTVKVNGKEIDVTLDEALKGYQREADYTQKTQQLAEQRKEFEAEKSKTGELQTAYMNSLQQLGQNLDILSKQTENQLGEEPDWKKAYETMDAKEYTLLVQNWQQRKENLQKIQTEQQRVAQEQQIEGEKIMRQHLTQQSDLMLQKLPQWKEASVRDKERAELIEYARTLGYTDEEVANASDHRAIVALYNSMKFEKLNSKTPEVKRKVRKAPKMAKSGVPRSKNEVSQRRRSQLRERHAKEGSVASAVDLLLSQRK